MELEPDDHHTLGQINTSPLPVAFETRLPLELWIEIFSYFWHSELCLLSVTCELFRRIAQFKLFRRILIQPISLDYETPRKYGEPLSEWRDDFQQRMRVCPCDETLKFVQLCTIQPLYLERELIDMAIAAGAGDDKPYTQFLDTAINIIPRFLNVQDVRFTHLPLTEEHLRVLSQLSSLRTLRVQDCIVDAIDSRFTITLHLVEFLVISTDVSLYNTDQWLSILNIGFIQHVYFRVGDIRLMTLPHISTCLPTIQHMTVLYTRITKDTLPLFASVLSLQPPLSMLAVASSNITAHDIDAYTYTTLPSLLGYMGPHELLSVISTLDSLTNLQSLHLFNMHGHGTYKAAEVIQLLLRWGPSITRLESFKCKIDVIVQEIFGHLRRLCPGLQTLKIRSPNSDSSDTKNTCVEVRFHLINFHQWVVPNH